MTDTIVHTCSSGATRRAILAATLVFHLAACMPRVIAQQPVKVARGLIRATEGDGTPRRRTIPISVEPKRVALLEVTPRGRVLRYTETPAIQQGGVAGVACGETTHADPDAFLQGATVTVEAGFGEGDIAWAQYQVPPASFPVRIDVMEFLLVKPNASADVVVEWSLLVWDGPPLGGVGLPIFTAESIGAVIPTARIPPGIDALLIQIVVDPDDPEPIVINNDTGQNSFTVGFRIDQHNAPSSNPCFFGPDPQNNAFPAVDLTLPSLTGNWLTGLESCFICGGTNSFATLDTTFCRPTGDWLIRTTFSCTLEGACCDVDAVCSDNMSDLICVEQGGTFMGGESLCSAVTCPMPVGACCVNAPSGPSCGDGLAEVLCEGFSGIYMGNGAQCLTIDCTPGACCLPDGSCDDMIELECDRAAGLFRGTNSECALTFDCPEPRGSCCAGTVCVPDQAVSFCEAIGVFNGIGTTCDANTCLCPAATITASDPPDGTVDARQPHAPDDGTLRQGIGTVVEPIIITLDPPVTGADAPACWSLCESPDDPLRVANDVFGVTELGGGQYEILLDHALTPSTVTSLTYAGGGSATRYTAHPGNVNADATANGQDFAFARAVLSGMANAPHGLYSIDLDHSGMMAPADLLRLIDLLIGGASFEAWLDSPQPVNDTCP